MRHFLRWSGRLFLVVLITVIMLGIWKREQVTRLLAVNSLFTEERIVSNFSNMNAAFLTKEVLRGDGPISDLPYGKDMNLPAGTLNWIAAHNVTSLLVMKDGLVRHESYYLGTTDQDRRISWSVAKSFLSALLGVVIADGHIQSLDDPVTKYVPSLVGSAYDGASLRNVLQMTSGVDFDEDYHDFNSDINKMGRVLALGGSMDEFTEELYKRYSPPGNAWHYVSIDTHVISMVIRGATGQNLGTLMAENIVAPLGFESAPYYLTDGQGVAFALGGLNLTTRDYARFGQMVVQGGRYGNEQVVPTSWVHESTTPSAPTQPGRLQYGYQWWMPADALEGEFFGHGIYGQYIYIDRAKGVVIIRTAADRSFSKDGVTQSNIAMFRKIAAAL